MTEESELDKAAQAFAMDTWRGCHTLDIGQDRETFKLGALWLLEQAEKIKEKDEYLVPIVELESLKELCGKA